jgi:2-dehydropantoate 2-reductase
MSAPDKQTIAIAGAGSIGCFVGGMLTHAEKDVRFLARPRIIDTVRAHGLTVTDLSGFNARLDPDALSFSDDPSILAGADIVLVCVKSGATAEMAAFIAEHAPENVVVISLQNGVSNVGVLRKALPNCDVRAGMVAYNVVNAGEGRFHRGVAGNILIDAGPGAVAEALTTPQLLVRESSDMPAVQWGKLLINLNNALNALSGLPLREELMRQGWRALLADQMAEAMRALTAEGISPRAATPLPPKLVPHIMRLPTPLYRLIAGRSLKIDPEARSSMWEDLELGRKTEIDELQGAVVALCDKHGLSAPVNARVAALIRECEEKGGGSPKLVPADIRASV